MIRFHFHTLRIFIPILGIFTWVLIYYLFIYDSRWDITDRVILQHSFKENIKKNNLYYKSNRHPHLACVHPYLNVDSPEVQSQRITKDTLICNQEEEDWVQVIGYEAIISHTAKRLHGKINCSFTALVRIDDDHTVKGFKSYTTNTFILNSDFYEVSCQSQDGKMWQSTLAGIHRDQIVCSETGWNLVPEESVKLNVLMLGFDSLSRRSFISDLPKTYWYLLHVLKSNILEGYNIVGDGTPQALIPILTGKTEFEFPETRRRMGKVAQFVNVLSFVWKDFKRNGYVTLFAEDQPQEGIFNLRLKGFDDQPTDHYMRTFFNYMFPSYKDHPNYCFYGTPRHKVFLKYVTDFFDVYEDKPRFAFAMHSELSHNDHNLISIADEDILQSLKYLEKRGHLNDTFLLLFSDHGNRFSNFRSTQQGKQEERLPFFSIYVPPKFKAMYPSAADNVKVNTRRLTTPFDLYPTLKDITMFSGAKLGKVTERGISLFSEIPPSRTCADASIETHWCACLTWDPLPVSNDKAVEASISLLHYINSFTAPYRSLCHEMKLLRLSSAALLLPNKELIGFRMSGDRDGFLPDFGDGSAISEEVYQVTIVVVPTKDYFHTSNDFPIFEASLTYNIKQDTFSVKMDDVSRINKYGDQPHCIIRNYPHLRKFCYCLEPP